MCTVSRYTLYAAIPITLKANWYKENFALVRYNPDGIEDPAFGENKNGIVTIPVGGVTNKGQSLVVQSDGKILMGGYTLGNQQGNGFALVRCLLNGTLDNSFGKNKNGIVVTPIGNGALGQGLAIQPDGKILLVGYTFDNISNKQTFALVRYNTDGIEDTNFGDKGTGVVITSVDGSSGDQGYSLFVLPDGKILLGGTSSKDANQNFAVVRYTSKGIPDSSFGNGTGNATIPAGTGSDAGGRSLAVDSAGGILLGGTKGNKDTEYQFAVARFTSNGTPDAQFGNSGSGLASTPLKDGNIHRGQSLKLQTDGKILVGGSRKTKEGTYQFAVARFLPAAPENVNVVTLITHYYQSILGRAPEASGLAYYQDKIAKAQAQGDVKPAFRQMGSDFFNSPEYLNRNTSNTAYITNLYKTFLQRDPETAGLQYYLDRLSKGESRNTFITDFTNSQEFANFMKSLGF